MTKVVLLSALAASSLAISAVSVADGNSAAQKDSSGFIIGGQPLSANPFIDFRSVY